MTVLLFILAIICFVLMFISIVYSIVDGNLWAGLCGFAMMAMGFGLLVLGTIADRTPCTTQPGAVVQWTNYTGGKSPRHFVYLTTSEDRNVFCKVDSQSLYRMGIGYKTEKSYTGYVVDRP